MYICIIGKTREVAERKLQQIKNGLENNLFKLEKDWEIFRMNNPNKVVLYDYTTYVATSFVNGSLGRGRQLDMVLLDEDLICDDVMWCIEPMLQSSHLPKEARIIYFKDEEE